MRASGAWLLLCLIGMFVAHGSAAAAPATDLRLVGAARAGDVAAARALIAQRADVNSAGEDGFTALHWATQRDNADLVEMLLAAGANAKATTRYNITPLYLAALNGDARIVERLLQAGADANGTSHEGQPAIMTAALAGNPAVIRALISHGATPNVTEPLSRQTALMWAAAEGNTSAAAMLMEVGAEVNAKSSGGLTPFLFAVRNGYTETANLLLEHGAHVNDVAADGSTALSMAIVNAYFELAADLLDHGADPNLPDPRGSALHAIAWLRKPGADGAAGVGNTPHGPPPPTGKVTALQLAKALLEHGANPNARVTWKETTFGKEGGAAKNPPNIQLGRHFLSYVGATPFYVAAKNGDVALMRLLLDGGADGTLPTKAGITPLMAAAGLDYWEGESPGPFTGVPESERLEAVKLALDSGNDINAEAKFGDYPMKGDVAYTLLYYPLNIDDLLELGVGDPRWSGSTALIGAVISGQPSIVQFLVDRGARLDARTALGWTPLAVAEGVFFANAKKEYPAAAAIIRKAMAERGLTVADASVR